MSVHFITEIPEDKFDEDLVLFSFDGKDVSFDICLMVEQTMWDIKIVADARIKVHPMCLERRVRREELIDVKNFVFRTDKNALGKMLTMEEMVRIEVSTKTLALLQRMWHAIAFELPSKYSPRTFPVFAWEISGNDVVEEIRYQSGIDEKSYQEDRDGNKFLVSKMAWKKAPAT